MPRLSDTMEEGTILRWLKRDGEQVKRGEELVEIETDKATMVYESEIDGTLALIAAEGETLAVGQPIASVGEGRENGSAEQTPEAGGTQSANAAPTSGDPSAGVPATIEQPAATGDGGTPPQDGEGAPHAGDHPRASPLARRIARREGIDLAAVTGTGPGGRIVKSDLTGSAAGEGAAAGTSIAAPTTGAGTPSAPAGAASPPTDDGAAAGPSTSAPAAGAGTPGAASMPGVTPTAATDAVATAKGTTTEVELNRLQQAVARRMAESKATIPDFTMALDVDMEACVGLRSELKGLAVEGTAPAPTYNDMVVKACALALREHPRANGSYRDGKLLLHSRVNVGVAVAAEGALVVPTVFDADTKALGEIARETRALAERVRAATITPPELGGGTFTVSNLGMYGIRSFTAIVNPPQAAIMSVGVLERRAVVGGSGQLEARDVLTLTLVCDHRILFGSEAAEFLGRVRELLQAPSALTL
jgi:pyruvate dehydrogenase E2 component (dihydrolipoamide acetyltransferase)